MPVFRRLRQALGIKVEEKFDDESIPVSLSDRLFWVPFGSRYYRQVKQRAWLVPLLAVFLVVCWLIGSIVTSWVYCAECRACRLAIPEGKCGTTISLPQGDLFCLRSGWTGFSPRLGKTQSCQLFQRGAVAVTVAFPIIVRRLFLPKRRQRMTAVVGFAENGIKML